MYEADLLEDIKAEQTVTSELRDGFFALLYYPAEYDARNLYHSLNSMNVLSSDKLTCFDCVKSKRNLKIFTIIDIMISRNHDEFKEIQSYYKKIFNKDLDKDLKNNFFLTAQFIRLLRTLAVQKRSTDPIDQRRSIEDATYLIESENISFKNETELIRIFTKCSFPQLIQISDQYTNLTGKTLSAVIKQDKELENDFRECALAILDFAQDIATFYSKRIKDSLSTNDSSLLRLIVTRSERDLELIKKKYSELFNVTLLDDINKKTSGYHQQLLKAVVGN